MDSELTALHEVFQVRSCTGHQLPSAHARALQQRPGCRPVKARSPLVTGTLLSRVAVVNCEQVLPHSEWGDLSLPSLGFILPSPTQSSALQIQQVPLSRDGPRGR